MPKLCPACKCRRWHDYKKAEDVGQNTDEVSL
jgi:hypothetical protein